MGDIRLSPGAGVRGGVSADGGRTGREDGRVVSGPNDIIPLLKWKYEDGAHRDTIE